MTQKTILIFLCLMAFSLRCVRKSMCIQQNNNAATARQQTKQKLSKIRYHQYLCRSAQRYVLKRRSAEFNFKSSFAESRRCGMSAREYFDMSAADLHKISRTEMLKALQAGRPQEAHNIIHASNRMKRDLWLLVAPYIIREEHAVVCKRMDQDSNK